VLEWDQAGEQSAPRLQVIESDEQEVRIAGQNVRNKPKLNAETCTHRLIDKQSASQKCRGH
jgi:hypothetical protein